MTLNLRRRYRRYRNCIWMRQRCCSKENG
jgi:hypothetical protein